MLNTFIVEKRNTIDLSRNECHKNAEILTIQQHILVNYDRNKIELQNVVLACSIVLSKKRKDESTALPTIPNYDPELPKRTRSTIDNTCTYRICKLKHFSTLFWERGGHYFKGSITKGVFDQMDTVVGDYFLEKYTAPPLLYS